MAFSSEASIDCQERSFTFNTMLIFSLLFAKKQLSILISMQEQFSLRECKEVFQRDYLLKFASIKNAIKHVIGIQKIVSLFS